MYLYFQHFILLLFKKRFEKWVKDMISQDIQKKVEFYKDKKLHISCQGKRFYNGKVLEINSEKEFIIFIDERIGEVPILFEEINFIEVFRERG